MSYRRQRIARSAAVLLFLACRFVPTALAGTPPSSAAGSPQTVAGDIGPRVAGASYLHPYSPSWGPGDLTIVYTWTKVRMGGLVGIQIHEMRLADGQDREILPGSGCY